MPMRRATPENFYTPRRHGRIRAKPADAECSNAPRQYDAPLNQRNPKLQRGFFTSLIRGRVCFRLSPPPPARGRRRRTPRSSSRFRTRSAQNKRRGRDTLGRIFAELRGGRHRAGAILHAVFAKKNEKSDAYSEEDISRDSSSRAGSETREISESSIRDFSAFAIALRASEMRAEMPSPSRDCANPSMRSAA